MIMRVIKGQRRGWFLGAWLVCAAFSSIWTACAQADVEMIKLYKKVFPEAKPKCMVCHIDKLPKKDEGAHTLNEYGLTLRGEDGEITVETIQAAGEAPAQAEVAVE